MKQKLLHQGQKILSRKQMDFIIKIGKIPREFEFYCETLKN